jgi:AcrR family transcriptional regulator
MRSATRPHLHVLAASSKTVPQPSSRRTEIVDAAKDLILAGKEITMREVATSALVSEATAYRYFPDLLSLLRGVSADVYWPQPAEAMARSPTRPPPMSLADKVVNADATESSQCGWLRAWPPRQNSHARRRPMTQPLS